MRIEPSPTVEVVVNVTIRGTAYALGESEALALFEGLKRHFNRRMAQPSLPSFPPGVRDPMPRTPITYPLIGSPIASFGGRTDADVAYLIQDGRPVAAIYNTEKK